jgi:hypothetical protein
MSAELGCSSPADLWKDASYASPLLHVIDHVGINVTEYERSKKLFIDPVDPVHVCFLAPDRATACHNPA